MMPVLNKLIKSLYLKVFVNIVIGQSQTKVYIEMVDNDKNVVNFDERDFNVTYLDGEMSEYISHILRESPFYYISILNNSLSQGAIPTCSKDKTAQFTDLSQSEYKCYNDSWTYYADKGDIYSLEKIFSKVGVDLMFSPFLVLANFFKDKVGSNLAIFILIEDGRLTLSVFNKSELLYADYLDMSSEFDDDDLVIDDDDDMDEMSLDDENIVLDDMDALDDMDELDDFGDLGDIADLDSIEEIDEFAESKDIEEAFLDQEEEAKPEKEADGFNDDYQRFSLIQSSINNFYQDSKYKSEFLENIYIADSVGVSTDLKTYLEEEMFLNVYIRRIELGSEVCEIAKMELL